MLPRIHNRASPLSFPQDPILFNNIKLDPERAYFIYVGEIKAYGLNPFLLPAFEQIYGRPVDCIAIVPDVLASYPYSNLAVLNSTSYLYHCTKGLLVNCRPSPGEFANEVSLASSHKNCLSVSSVRKILSTFICSRASLRCTWQTVKK
jgi:hypothetical protein